jgi:hypothetical protein
VKIDDRIEPLVREAFAAVVASEPARLDSALAAIAGAGDEAAGYALRLALAVDRMALMIIHSASAPRRTNWPISPPNSPTMRATGHRPSRRRRRGRSLRHWLRAPPRTSS